MSYRASAANTPSKVQVPSDKLQVARGKDLKQKASRQKSPRDTVSATLQAKTASPEGIAAAPPDYGFETVGAIEALQGDGIVQQADQSQTMQKMANAPALPNQTGLPDNLKTGIENMSGMAMNDVRVHYNSEEPARHGALAFARGSEIHVGQGQERHLPHEAWHVVQQKQGRVTPTIQAKGVAINDDSKLEREADVMGARAIQGGVASPVAHRPDPPVTEKASFEQNLPLMMVKNTDDLIDPGIDEAKLEEAKKVGRAYLDCGEARGQCYKGTKKVLSILDGSACQICVRDSIYDFIILNHAAALYNDHVYDATYHQFPSLGERGSLWIAPLNEWKREIALILTKRGLNNTAYLRTDLREPFENPTSTFFDLAKEIHRRDLGADDYSGPRTDGPPKKHRNLFSCLRGQS